MVVKSSRYLQVTKTGGAPPSGRATPGERIFGKMFPNRTTVGGGWSSDRINYVQHMTDWVYVAINAIWSKTAAIMPNLAYVTDVKKPGMTVKACERGLLNASGRGFGGSAGIGVEKGFAQFVDHRAWTPAERISGGFTGSFLTMGEYYSKALSVVKPHDELEPLESGHLLRRLIENPNVQDTSYDLLYEWGMYLELCGISYLWALPNAFGKPAELWVIPAHWVWPRTGGGDRVDEDDPNAEKMVDYYEVRPISLGGMGTAGMIRIPAGEVIVARHKSPLNKLDGYSRLWAISRWIDTQESISKSRWAQFINQARPEFWVELGPGYTDPDDDMISRMEARIAAKHQGEFNMGKPIFTPAGAKVTPLSFSPTEMAYHDSMEQVRDMILSSFGVPKSAVGVVTDMTYGSILATLMCFCEQAINPRLAMLGQVLTKQLASRWDDETRKCKLWWDNCSPADPAQVNSDLQVDLQGNWITPNEGRALRGRKAYKLGGDNPLVQGPGGLMPLPINAEESMDDLGELVAMYTNQVAGGKDADKLATMESNEDLPKDVVDGAGDEQQPHLLAAESLDGDAGIEEPNGKPQKSLDRIKSWDNWFATVGYAKQWESIKDQCGRGSAEPDGWVERALGFAHITESNRITDRLREKRLVQKQSGAHDYATTQFDLTGDALAQVALLQSRISKDDLKPEGMEDRPHVTVRYGLLDDSPAAVQAMCAGRGVVRALVGEVDYFPNDGHDVLILRVESDDLVTLNAELGELPNVQTYPDYQPHVTLAYLKPGCGEKYARELAAEPVEVEFDQLVFSDRSGQVTSIPLTYAGEAAPDAVAKSSGTQSVYDMINDFLLEPSTAGVREVQSAIRRLPGIEAAAVVRRFFDRSWLAEETAADSADQAGIYLREIAVRKLRERR